MENSKTARPTGRVSLLINCICLLTSSWGLYRLCGNELPVQLAKAGQKQFLTNLAVGGTIINNLLNITSYATESGGMTLVARHLTLPIALVLETIVSLVYWPLRLFFIQWIIQGAQPGGPAPIPLSVDISVHFLPTLFLFADHYLSGSGLKFKLSNRLAWAVVTAIGFGYYSFLGSIIDKADGQAYPYPFLDVAQPKRSIVFVVVTTIAWLVYVLYQKFPPLSKSKRDTLESKLN